MTNLKNFLKLAAIACCLLIPSFSSTRVVNGQKEQLPDKRKGDTEAYVIVEGDIQVSRDFFQKVQAAASSPQAAPISFEIKLWPNGVVPFEFNSNVSAENQTRMLNAMAVLEAVANVDFRQCGDNDCGENFVHIQNSDGNNSAVGMQGSSIINWDGSQDLNIASWGSRFTIVHELLHCLGFFHEQSRSNRSDYIRIHCDNVQDGCGIFSDFGHNFDIEDDATSYGYYDFDSVMHYDQCAFSKDCPSGSTCACTNRTITVLPPNDTEWQSKIGQRTHLSVLDKASVSFLYPNPDWRFVDFSYNGSRGLPVGTFLRPYTTLAGAIANTPEGGTLWVLRTRSIPAVGTYSKRITIKVAPGVEAILGD